MTGTVFRADAAHRLLRSDPDEAADLLATARQDLRTALVELRGVVFGLRPLELQQYGLWEALRRREGPLGDVNVSVALPADPPVVRAATEIAIFRIVTEALTNVHKHATASGAVVEVVAGDTVEVTITDDGATTTAWEEGTGITSIRVRAEELGGVASIGPIEGGWRVEVALPRLTGPGG